MTNEEAIAIITIERNCVERQIAALCDRDCGACDLALTDDEITEAYNMAIEALLRQREADDGY